MEGFVWGVQMLRRLELGKTFFFRDKKWRKPLKMPVKYEIEEMVFVAEELPRGIHTHRPRKLT